MLLKQPVNLKTQNSIFRFQLPQYQQSSYVFKTTNQDSYGRAPITSMANTNIKYSELKKN